MTFFRRKTIIHYKEKWKKNEWQKKLSELKEKGHEPSRAKLKISQLKLWLEPARLGLITIEWTVIFKKFGNVCSAEKYNKRSSNTLLLLVYFAAE